MTFRYRDQRGSLEESMKTVIPLEDRSALVRYLRAVYGDQVPFHSVTVEWYGYDSRIDWQTYLVSIDDRAVGFTDGPAT